jgi:arginase
VIVSGDCATALGTVSGLQHAGTDPSIVWIDAHGDLQALESTTSGSLNEATPSTRGGMP